MSASPKAAGSEVGSPPLPESRPGPAGSPARAATDRAELSTGLLSELRSYADSTGASPHQVLHAAFASLLARYTGQASVAFGVEVPSDDPGPPARPQLLRLEVDLSAGLVEAIARVNAALAVGASAEQSSPGSELAFGVVLAASGAAACVTYRSELLEGAAAARTARHFTRLLTAALASPGHPMGSLPLLNADEEQQLLVGWNETTADYPRHRCVDQLISDQALATPERTAVELEDAKLTYRELNRCVDGLASRLIAEGVGRGACVGVYLERSLEMVVATLAVMRAGAFYLPLDPAFPTRRLAYMLESAGALRVLTSPELRATLPDPRAAMFVELEALKPGSEPPPDLARSSEDLCYVLYTSGSTGLPKGVEVTHRSLVNLLVALRIKFGIRSDDVLAAPTTFSFDLSALELFLPLICGAQVSVLPRGAGADGGQLRQHLRRVRASCLMATPTGWRIAVEAGLDATDGLRLAMVGGEAFPIDLANQLRARIPEVWNAYGPTVGSPGTELEFAL